MSVQHTVYLDGRPVVAPVVESLHVKTGLPAFLGDFRSILPHYIIINGEWRRNANIESSVDFERGVEFRISGGTDVPEDERTWVRANSIGYRWEARP